MESRTNIQAGVSFSRFLRYFVPGWFTALCFFLYASRFAHPEINRAIGLFSYYYNSWSKMLPVVFALGGFFGVFLVGLDIVVLSFIGSRTLHQIFKYALSSLAFPMTFMSNFEYRDIGKAVRRLPRELVNKSMKDCGELTCLANGSPPNKRFLTEVAHNYFWYDTLTPEHRHELKQTKDISSMYFSLSAVSLLFLVFQVSLYALTNWNKSLLRIENTVPIIILAYVSFNILTNLLQKLRGLFTQKKNNHTKKPTDSTVNQKKNERKHGFRRQVYMIFGAILFVAFLVLIYPEILTRIAWFEFVDPILMGVFLVFFVSTYWAGTYRYSRYYFNYARHFYERQDEIESFLLGNSTIIWESYNKISGERIEKKNAGLAQHYRFDRCTNCDSLAANVSLCSCGLKFCHVCALKLGNCPRCGSFLARIKHAQASHLLP